MQTKYKLCTLCTDMLLKWATLCTHCALSLPIQLVSCQVRPASARIMWPLKSIKVLSNRQGIQGIYQMVRLTLIISTERCSTTHPAQVISHPFYSNTVLATSVSDVLLADSTQKYWHLRMLRHLGCFVLSTRLTLISLKPPCTSEDILSSWRSQQV